MSRSQAPCEGMRERIHEVFDTDDPGAVPEALAEHLVSCASCRAMHDDLSQLRTMLRDVPASPLPGETLEAVWASTVKRGPARRNAAPWMRAAAAALAATALIATSYLMTRTGSGTPSRDEIARAEAQADLVFGYTAKALEATRSAAADRVFADKIVPAVRGNSPGTPPGKRG